MTSRFRTCPDCGEVRRVRYDTDGNGRIFEDDPRAVPLPEVTPSEEAEEEASPQGPES